MDSLGVVEPFIIEQGGSSLYAVLHRPAAREAGAVLFCDPLLEERKSSNRFMWDAAQCLCARGFTVLRFDYRGCGDSAGEFNEFSVPDWLEDIGRAAQALASATDGRPIGVLGLRMGASLALAALARGVVEGAFAVLLEPVIRGDVFIEQELRRKLVKEMVTFGRSRGSGDALRDALRQGETIDGDGYAISARLYRDLGQIDLPAMTGVRCPRALVVQVSHQAQAAGPLQDLQAMLASGGCGADLHVVAAPPFWNLVGLADYSPVVADVGQWVERAGASTRGQA